MSNPKFDPRFDPFLLALGRVATGWAQYEFTINSFIWELSNIERIAGTCITSQLIGPGPRFRCLLALLQFRKAPQSLIGAFNSHHAEAEKVGRQRNRFLHDPLMVDEDTGKMSRMEITADKHVKHDFVSVEVDDLNKLDDKITKLDDEFDALYERALAEIPPWPKTQFEQSDGIRAQRIATDSSA